MTGGSDTEIASGGDSSKGPRNDGEGGEGLQITNYKLQFTNYKYVEDAVSKLQITIYNLQIINVLRARVFGDLGGFLMEFICKL